MKRSQEIADIDEEAARFAASVGLMDDSLEDQCEQMNQDWIDDHTPGLPFSTWFAIIAAIVASMICGGLLVYLWWVA